MASHSGLKRAWDDVESEELSQEDTNELCSLCLRIFNRPDTYPPNSRRALHSGMHQIATAKTFHVFVNDVAISASSGCPLCILVEAKISSFHIYNATTKRSEIRELKCHLNRWEPSSTFRTLRYEVKDSILDHFLIQLLPESDVKDMALGQLRPPSTASEECSTITTQWLVDCLATHEKCRSMDHTPWLPTRLIDIGSNWNSPEPRLVVTTELAPGNTNYICLSHLWAAGTIITLTLANIDMLKHGIPIDSLSSTFRDALYISRRLGVRYVWIDSLCILQDSVEDWTKESIEMGKIYNHSLCNTAATASSINHGGLLQERDARLITPYRVRFNYKGHDRMYAMFNANLFVDYISDAYLNKRGWVFQERMLSPRTLHCASQLFWECRELQACETFPAGLPTELNEYADHKGPLVPFSLKNWQEEINREWAWNDLIEIYANCELTRSPDRLMAIAGIAKEVQLYVRDEYLEGMWKKDLPIGLLWSLSNVGGKVIKSREYRCPSWSWASLDFEYADIDFISPGNIESNLVTVVEARVVSASDSIYGSLKGGYIVLRGRIGQISLVDISNKGVWIGQWSYNFHFDIADDSYDQPIYCLPIAIQNLQPSTSWPAQTECLLLKKVESEKLGFERV